MAAKQDFQLGDLVKLASGGPVMTVDEIMEQNGHRMAKCIWFGEGQFHTQAFNVETLVKG